jgi:TrpR family transcriptional regulator, trp operon repressor
VDEDAWQMLLEMLSKLRSAEQAGHLLQLIMTHEERETFAARTRVLQALLEGQLTQRQIAQQFGVSISQITRGSNALKEADPALVQFVQKQLTCWRRA